MLNRTHIAIAIFSILLFLQHVVNKTLFVFVMLFATMLPNIHQLFDKIIFLKPLKSLIRKEIVHSFTICILITLFFAFYFPIFAFAFFLGYSVHLLADSWTPEGIRPFWPSKAISKGRVTEGGSLEETTFMVFAILDIVLVIVYFL